MRFIKYVESDVGGSKTTTSPRTGCANLYTSLSIMRYCLSLKVGNIEEPTTMKGDATKYFTGSAMARAISNASRKSRKALFFLICVSDWSISEHNDNIDMLIDAITESMSYTILGLGNPGEEYKETRHNVGAIILDSFAKKITASEWKNDGVRNALVAKAEIGGDLPAGRQEKLLLIKPQAFMNKSGVSVRDLVGAKKKLENMIVIHDDLDLPIGSMKIVFDRGSGGHKGVESINRAVKSTAYTRIRIGVCPTTPSGKLKKPDHKKILDFIVGELKASEVAELKKVTKKACEALEVLITESRQKAMTDYN